MKKLFLLLIFFSFLNVSTTFAAGNSFVSIVNPIRGSEFWDIEGQKPETAVLGQISILKQFNFPAL